LSNPLLYDGQEIILEDHLQVNSVSKDRFEITQDYTKILVIGISEGLRPGDYLSLRANFHRQGYLTLQELHINKLWSLKMVGSLFAAIFITGLFFMRYRFSFKHLCFVERTACRT
jgi:hypothetical protein